MLRALVAPQSFVSADGANTQLKAHQETVALFEQGAKEARDPQVKAFATKTLPKLQEHLKMAKELHGKVSK